jgi:hypothetical protein
VYKLDAQFARGHYTVTVAGCGGTGAFVAESLCRLLPGNATLLLVDHDLIEEANLTRQNFYHDELGRRKSEALAVRLCRRFQRPVAYSTMPIGSAEIPLPGIVIGCLDNGPARTAIAEKRGMMSAPYGYVSWWVDAGNGESYGQVLIGNDYYGRGGFDEEKSICFALPIPTVQRPDLLSQMPPPAPGCAQIPEQGPTINQAMAAIVVEVVRRIVVGTCPWMQVYLDLENGTLSSVLATPEAVPKILGKTKRRRKGG